MRPRRNGDGGNGDGGNQDGGNRNGGNPVRGNPVGENQAGGNRAGENRVGGNLGGDQCSIPRFKKGVNFISLNVRSLLPKLSEVRRMLEISSASVLALNETLNHFGKKIPRNYGCLGSMDR